MRALANDAYLRRGVRGEEGFYRTPCRAPQHRSRHALAERRAKHLVRDLIAQVAHEQAVVIIGPL